VKDLKKEFLSYLRSVYGADTGMSTMGLPPMQVSGTYPTFRREQDAMALMGGLPPMGMQSPMSPMGMGMNPMMSAGGGMGMTGLGALGGLGGAGMGAGVPGMGPSMPMLGGPGGM